VRRAAKTAAVGNQPLFALLVCNWHASLLAVPGSFLAWRPPRSVADSLAAAVLLMSRHVEAAG
jgi:hypothetical protein